MRRDRGLVGARAEQPGLGPVTQRQAQGIEQNRFPGAGFAGENAQPLLERQIETVDQDDIADRQADQHAGLNVK